MKIYSFHTMIEPDDPKGYHGFVPLLPGLHTGGDSINEVKKTCATPSDAILTVY